MQNKEISKKDKETIRKEIVSEIKNNVKADVLKEVKSTIITATSDYKEDLMSDILEDVNSEVVDLVKREERRLLRGKNAAILKRDAIIVLLVIVGLYFGYCLYDIKYFDFMKSECEKAGNCYVTDTENKNTEEVENKEPVLVKDKKWYIENYGYLLDNAKLSLNADNVSAYYLYSSDRKVSDIKSSVLLNMAYKSVDAKNIKSNSVSISILGSDLRNAFEKLFGSLTNYKATSFTYNCLHFKYNQEKDKYTAENVKCSKSNNKILENIEDIYEEGNVLYIITNATIYNENEGSFYTFDNLYEPVLSDVTDTDLESNARKLNRYQYQFKKQDDNYYLDSIIKLK